MSCRDATRPSRAVLPWHAGLCCAGLLAIAAPLRSDDGIEFFERDVRPLLAEHCYSCHGAANALSGLRLDSREAVLRGGARGPAAVPGKPGESLLVSAVRHETLRMPMGGKLPGEAVESLAEWVRRGLPWPSGDASGSDEDVASLYGQMRREHWAYQPVRQPASPDAGSGAWSKHPVDRFLLAKLGEASLEPNPPAEREEWIRRASFVLTGLPPSPSEVVAFVRDGAPGAYRRVVDRLLDSPHYGEHWARHWLDVVRFGETLGNDWNYENNGAWLYRDYAIRAFNEDVPYDDFVREHVAGDLIAEPRLGADGSLNESLIGTFFFRLGEQGHDDCTQFREVRTDVVDDQIDTLGKAFQGLTIACARCHDHKLDPIPTADYYALYGVLDSSRLVTRTVDRPGADASVKRRLRALKAQIRAAMASQWLAETGEISTYLMASLSADPEGFDGDPERVERLRKLAREDGPAFANPVSVWGQTARALAGRSGASMAAAWEDLAARFEAERQRIAAFNEEHFEPLADFGRGESSGWHAEGRAFEPALAADGAYAVAPSGDEVVSGIFPAGAYTHLLSDRLNGALRSPHLPRDRKYASLRVVGGKLAAWRTVLDNCMLSERYELIDRGEFGWVRVPLRDEHDEYRLYLELVTKHDNPRLPDRPDRMKAIDPDQMAEPRSYFGVTRAVLHDREDPPEDSIDHLQPLFEGGSPADLEALAARYAALAREAVEAWAENRADGDHVRWLRWLLGNRLVANTKYFSPELRELVDRYRTWERRLHEPQVVQGMADLDPGRDVPVLVRGQPDEPGPVVQRGFLSLLEHLQPASASGGSGRAAVAEMLADPRNPLTARVMVNRVWHHLFGRGIVPTVDNLGRFGEPPSHPELLDALASRFVESGWSVKGLIRHIALSQAFRQSSVAPPAKRKADPDNRLLSRYPVRRLGAESVRDAILVASGSLDRTLYGPSIHPYRERPKDYRKLFSGPLGGNGRRSIYLKVTRHEGSAFLEVMDFPPPLLSRGRRNVTNVPSQALALLNDPFVVSEAGHWADALIEESSETPADRLRTMFRVVLGRLPDAGELDRFEALAARLAELHGAQADELLTSRPVWRDMAHSIFNLKEFLYLR